MLHVPFKGGGPAMIDVIGGHTKVMFSSLVSDARRISAPASCRRSASAALKRNPVLPDVPTIAEAGVPGYEAVNWWGIVAPAGTPPPIVEKLHKAITAVQDIAGGAEAVRDRGRRDRADELGRVRRPSSRRK